MLLTIVAAFFEGRLGQFELLVGRPSLQIFEFLELKYNHQSTVKQSVNFMDWTVCWLLDRFLPNLDSFQDIEIPLNFFCPVWIFFCPLLASFCPEGQFYVQLGELPVQSGHILLTLLDSKSRFSTDLTFFRPV